MTDNRPERIDKGALSSPAARAMMNVCLDELSRLRAEFSETKGRMLEQLAEALFRDVWSSVTPGTMVVQLPRNAENADDPNSAIAFAGGITFIPSWKSVPVLDAQIVRQSVRPSERAIDLEIKVTDVSSLFGYAIYFDLANSSRHDEDLWHLLPFTLWCCDDTVLKTRSRPHGPLRESRLRTWHDTVHFFDHRFVELNGFVEDRPHAVEQTDVTIHPVRDAGTCTLSVYFPQSTPIELLKSIRCLLNCVPVIQLSRHSVKPRIKRESPTIELDDHAGVFAGIDEIVMVTAGERSVVPADGFNVRRFGVAAFNDLNAKEKILDALRSLRTEYQAYLGMEKCREDLDTLLNDIAELERRVASRQTVKPDDPVFVQFQDIPEDSELEIRYFSTCDGLKKPPMQGDSLKVSGGVATVVSAYHDPGRQFAHTRADQLKHAVLSRSRIVTKADIVTACRSFLGTRSISGSEQVRKGAILSPKPEEGIVDCIFVTVNPAVAASSKVQEWGYAVRQLEEYLHEHSATGMRFRVVTVAAETEKVA